MAPANPPMPHRTEELLAHTTWLQGLAARLVRDQAERDDLVQETWLAALRHPLAMDRRDLRAWLAAVLRNRWRFTRRSDARRRARESARGEREPVPCGPDLIAQAELQGSLMRAVLALEEPYRSTVLQRYSAGRTCRAIARSEGVPEGTVRSRLKRALDLLRTDLDRAHGGERRAWVLTLVPLARLARTRAALETSAALVAATLVTLWLGWSWLARAGSTPAELVSAPVASAPVELEPASRAPEAARPERTPLVAGSTPAGVDTDSPVAGHVELLVLDPEGRPIPAASVVAGAHRQPATTDAHGRCRIPDEAWSASSCELLVSAPGFVPSDAPLDRQAGPWSNPWPIFLPRATALEGRLRDADTGLPVADAELRMLFGYWNRPLARATSGTDGTFRLEPAPRGYEVGLVIHAPDHPASQRLVQIASTERAFLELELAAGAELRGRVVDAWSGAPLAGARVFHESNGFEGAPGEDALELATSDAGGEIVVRVAEPEAVPALLFVHPGYCSRRVNPSASGFEVALLSTATLAGTVRDEQGRAVAGSMVTLGGMAREVGSGSLRLEAPPDAPLARMQEATLLVPAWRVETDDQGRFRVPVVPGHPSHPLIVQGAGHVSEFRTIEELLQPGETRRIEIQVRRSATIAGVLSINGEQGWGVVQCLAGGKRVASDWARPDGTFEVRGVPPGRIELKAVTDAQALRFAPAASGPVLAEVEVEAGETRRLELEYTLELGTIRGRVTSPAGRARAFASVRAQAGRNGANWSALTDENGNFELRLPLEPPTYELSTPGSARIPAPVNSEGVELVSVGHGRVRVRARDADRQEPIERVTLFVRRAEPRWEWAGEFASGTNGFAQWVLESGWLELAAGKPEEGYPLVFLGTFTLEEDGELELDVPLARVQPVEFVLTNPPLPGVCLIRLEAKSALPMQRSYFSGGPSLALRFQEGRASIPGLAAGAYRLVASFPDVVVEPAEIGLGPERPRPIELTWQRRD